MPSTASATDPVSHYEAFSTLWAAARSARGTDLRGESLINLDVLSTVPESFVAELPSKLRPASIEHGLSQAGSGQSPGIDIADEDTPVFELFADSLHSVRVQAKELAAAAGPIPIRKQHLDKVAGTCKINNPDAKFSRELVRFYSRSLSGAASVYRVTRMRSAHTNATPRRSTIGVFQRQFAIITATESTPPTLPECRGLRRGEFG